MKFFCFGHNNLLATHKATFEFSKSGNLTLNGDCIVGVNSNFSVNEELQRILCVERIRINIYIGDYKETIWAIPNKGFCHDEEIVIRKSDFLSDRTFAIKADKAAADFNREMVKLMQDPLAKIEVEIADEKDTN